MCTGLDLAHCMTSMMNDKVNRSVMYPRDKIHSHSLNSIRPAKPHRANILCNSQVQAQHSCHNCCDSWYSSLKLLFHNWYSLLVQLGPGDK